MPLRLSSLHQRAFHREPYPESSPPSPISPQGKNAQPLLSPLPAPPRPSHAEPLWITLYFIFNLGLTLYNKVVLSRFPFPYTLTALHALLGTIGCFILVQHGVFQPAILNSKETAVLVAFSFLYTVNIAISNLSLQLVTVAFHQIVRASTPIFTLILWSFLYGNHSSREKIVSLVPVVVGVGLSTFGDYNFTSWGLFLTLIGTILAACKTIVTNVLQSPPQFIGQGKLRTRSVSLPRLHPLDLLRLLSPLAFFEALLLAHLSGELDRVKQYSRYDMTSFKAFALLVNGCIAFGLNVVSFTANKRVGALSMTVAGNVKQALTIVSGVLIFDLTISTTNGIGILLTLFGGAWYARTDYIERRNRTDTD